MLLLLSLIAILAGAGLVLTALVMIAPEVRVHAIDRHSRGSRLFRAGIAFSLMGSALAALSDNHTEALLLIAQLIGGTSVLAGIIVWGHEWRQSREAGNERWKWWRSLTSEMILAGLAMLIIARLLMV
jgi:hypothetical protein